MKKLIISLLFLTVIYGVKAQDFVVPEETWKVEEITGSSYHGYSFHKNWEVDFTIESQDGRYTPTNDDIVKAEQLVKKRLAYVNRNHENQGGRCPVVDEHILKYERQYVGFTDMHGYHIIWINFVWDENAKDRLDKDILLTEGGCSHYWHLKVNIDTEKVYGLEVNYPGEVKYLPRNKRKGLRISRPKKDYTPQRIRKTGIMHNPAEVTF